MGEKKDLTVAEAVERGLRVRHYANPTTAEQAALRLAEMAPQAMKAIAQAVLQVQRDGEAAMRELAMALEAFGMEVPKAAQGKGTDERR